MSVESGWTPDRETVLWWMGTANEDRIVESLEREIKDRSRDVTPDSSEYWRLVAEVAVEHLTFDMLTMAKKWGTEFPDTNWGS